MTSQDQAERANPANNPQFLISLESRVHEDAKARHAVYELFNRGDLLFLLHDGQRKCFDILQKSDSKEFLVFCSRQFGKSFFGLVFALMFLQKSPRKRAYVFAATNKDAVDIVNDNLAVIERLAPPNFLLRQKTDRRWKLANGSELRIGSLEEPRRGRNCHLVITEEGAAQCSSANFEYAMSSVIGPMLLRAPGARMIHITTPSTALDHIVHTNLLPRLDFKGAVARFTIYDNPQLSEQQIEDARNRCLSEEDWEREYLVKIVRSSVLTVIPEYEPNLHIRQKYDMPDLAHWCLGLDLGGTKDRHGIVLGYYDFRRAKRIITHEAFPPINTADDELAHIIKGLLANVPKTHTSVVVADAPGQVRINLAKLGVPTFMPKKKKGSFEAGINELRWLFKKNEIEIDRDCTNLQQALKYGQFNKQRNDFARTDSLGHCDMLAALIYQQQMQRIDNPFPDNYKRHHDIDYYDVSEGTTEQIEQMLFG